MSNHGGNVEQEQETLTTAEGSETEGSETEGSETEGSETEGSETEGSDHPVVCVPSLLQNNEELLESIRAIHCRLLGVPKVHFEKIIAIEKRLLEHTTKDYCESVEDINKWKKDLRVIILDIEKQSYYVNFSDKLRLPSSPPDSPVGNSGSNHSWLQKLLEELRRSLRR